MPSMPSNVQTEISPKMLWAGRVVSALPVLALFFSAAMKLAQAADVVKEFTRLGYGEGTIFGIGLVELACTVLYVVPRTSFWGAILLTGYLGGAVATHVRIGDPFVPPIIMGVLLWLGLLLRDRRVQGLAAGRG